MRYLTAFVNLIVCLGFLCPQSQAQEHKHNLISGNFEHLTIREFTGELEKQTGYYFYYDSATFDSLRITLTAHNESLDSVLSRAFQNTDFNYSVGLDNEVYLTRFTIIDTTLEPLAIDSIQKKRNKNTRGVGIGVSQAEYIQIAALENKLYQIGINAPKNGLPNALLSGYVRDSKTGEPIT